LVIAIGSSKFFRKIVKFLDVDEIVESWEVRSLKLESLIYREDKKTRRKFSNFAVGKSSIIQMFKQPTTNN